MMGPVENPFSGTPTNISEGIAGGSSSSTGVRTRPWEYPLTWSLMGGLSGVRSVIILLQFKRKKTQTHQHKVSYNPQHISYKSFHLKDNSPHPCKFK